MKSDEGEAGGLPLIGQKFSLLLTTFSKCLLRDDLSISLTLLRVEEGLIKSNKYLIGNYELYNRNVQ